MTPPAPPKHIAVIMDGNGRWARERGLPRSAGHRAGAESVRECVEGCKEMGVNFLTLYAFSVENWSRPQSEIDTLMKLLERFLREKSREMMEWNVRLKAIGRLHLLPAPCRKALDEAIALTATNEGITLTLALSYGGREEIADAAAALAQDVLEGHLDPQDITPAALASRLYTSGIPDPDLLIRTSGELRISNFLLWQISYTEIIVLRKNWPDFKKSDLIEAVAQFQRRRRRFGSVDPAPSAP